jgi:hypothetical protein
VAEPTFAKTHQAIGAFFCAFSALDGELGETVKVIFRLQQHEAADTIIAALEDFARKTRLVRGAVSIAKNADGSETSDQWKTAADKTMTEILAANDNRVLLAHSVLDPNEDGSVKIKRLHLPQGVIKSREVTWTKTDFERKIDELRKLARELQGLKNDLSTFRITVPTGWMTLDPYQPHLTRMGSAAVLTSEVVNPIPPPSEESK